MSTRLVLVALSLVGWTSGSAWALSEESPHHRDPYWYVNHSCVLAAAQRYQISPQILEAHVYVESRGNPYAVSVPKGGQPNSLGGLTYSTAHQRVQQLSRKGVMLDVGLAQINSTHMHRFGLDPVVLLDPCTNLQWAAYVIRDNINRYGETWTAVGRYVGSPKVPTEVLQSYSWKIYQALHVLQRVRQQRGVVR